MDRRQKKTKLAIMEAFCDLLETKSYNKITVQEIIDAADVGRTTFYSNFPTKDALLEDLCTTLFFHVFQEHPTEEKTHCFSLSAGSAKGVICHLIYHLRDYGENITKLLVSENSEVFLHYFSPYFDKVIKRRFLVKVNPENANVPPDFLEDHIIGTFVNLIKWWVKNDMKESPEALTEYFMAVIDPIL